MPKKKSYITVTDQFCGAGGSSQGVRRLSNKNGGGVEVALAMNHWKLAIETHNTNFPDTLHDCTDISACDPRRYTSTDILITSPECTNHSLAKGAKVVKNQMDMFTSGALDPTAERSRATMWDVVRFAEYHQYNSIIVENVVDARKWVMFEAWLMAMKVLGYSHKCVYLNSMHCHPTPQSRDRMYVVFWKLGNRAPNLDFTPKAHCQKCEKDILAVQTWKNADKRFGKYRQQYVYCCPAHGTIVEPYYYASFNCIDWSDRGNRIGDRKKPLATNTLKRINYGLDKYAKQPFVIHGAYSDQARGVVRSVTDPAFTQTTFQSQAIINPPHIVHNFSPGYSSGIEEGLGTITTTDHHAVLIPPFIINDQHSTGIGFRVRSVLEEVQGITTQPHFKVIFPPFVFKGEHTLQDGYVASCFDPLQTHTTRQSMGIVSTDSWNSFIAQYYNGSHCTRHITDALGTITTSDRSGLYSYKTPDINDCYYRMMKAPEVKLGMGFDGDYIVLGNQKDQVKQCGNAVTPPAMEWLIERVIESMK